MQPEADEVRQGMQAEEVTGPAVDACLYCPCCSHRLTERKCKLLCETCGYFMSCADYH